MRINMVPGRAPIGHAFCFACRAKGNWNWLAPKIGLRKLKGAQINTVHVGAETTKELLNPVDHTNYHNSGVSVPWPIEETWRGISGTLLNRMGAYKYYSPMADDLQLHIPVKVNNQQVGGVNAVIERTPDTKIAYWNLPGEWAKTSLFAYDTAREMLDSTKGPRILLIGEGPRDALNPLQHNLAAVATLGTTWSQERVNLILELEPDVVLVGTDNDEPGEKLARKISRSLKGKTTVHRVKFPQRTITDPETGATTVEKWDPGKLTAKQLAKLRDRTRQVAANGGRKNDSAAQELPLELLKARKELGLL